MLRRDDERERSPGRRRTSRDDAARAVTQRLRAASRGPIPRLFVLNVEATSPRAS
jgi:hypothetical protein